MTTLERNQLIKDGSNMSNDKPKSTFYSIAASDADLDLGGRYAKVHSTTVTGATPGSAFPQMESGPWAKDECPPEQPLGYSVNEQDPVDEMFEWAAQPNIFGLLLQQASRHWCLRMLGWRWRTHGRAFLPCALLCVRRQRRWSE